jgi:predicted amino acid racemase
VTDAASPLRVTVALDKIEANTRLLAKRLLGLDIVGVTKVTCGNPDVASAMIRGGAKALADSRLANLSRLKAAKLGVPLWLLRAPVPQEAPEVVRLADVSLNTEIKTVEALDSAAGGLGVTHGIVAMVELGDLREGLLEEELSAFVLRLRGLRHVRLCGLGVNLACFSGAIPTVGGLRRLAALGREAESLIGHPLALSGGNSSTIGLALDGNVPASVNNLRIGESILLGVNTLTRAPLPDLHHDAIILSAPVIECRRKASSPAGPTAQDAFGHRPHFADDGPRLRAILEMGRQDAPPEGLFPVDSRIRIVGATSDHTICDVEELDPPPGLGEEIEFVPSYAATLQAFTSPYVEKVMVSSGMYDEAQTAPLGRVGRR